ncbi:MAG TPA: cache domain-containing protein [Desulfosporosinus sp.]|nr:cache domain-containing protein [Desulfosporosinus sp.]
MRSFKHRILILLLGSLVVLAGTLLGFLSWYMNERAVAAAIIKAQTDLAICGEIIDARCPGSWSVRDGDLYKGPIKISFDSDLVDYLSLLTGDTVTVFLGETRVATTVRNSNGERAIGTQVSANVAQEVLKDGQTYVGKADVVGQWYQSGYVPLRAEEGNIIGMFNVGISHAYEQEIITRSLITMAELGLALTIMAALLTWVFIQRVIIFPLHNITLGSRDVAAGQLTEKIESSSPKEIRELEDTFSQMVEQIRSLIGKIDSETNIENTLQDSDSHAVTDQIVTEQIKGNVAITGQTTDVAVVTEPMPPSRLDTPWCNGEEGLPKGFNKATLGQIVQFLRATRRPISVEEVAEGVKMTRVTVRRYLEFLELRGVLNSELKYGTVGRPVKMFIPM